MSDLSKDKQYENDNKKGKECVVWRSKEVCKLCVDSGTQKLMQFSKDSKRLHLISLMNEMIYQTKMINVPIIIQAVLIA